MRKVLSLVVFVSSVTFAQPDPAAEQKLAAQKQAIGKLGFLAGEWDGTGWILYGDRKIEVLCHETLQSKLDGTLMVVEGLHHAKQPDGSRGRVVHHAMGIFSFDPQANTYGFRTYVLRGGGRDAWAKVVADGHVEWGFTEPGGGNRRYTIKLTPAGEWHEIGERSSGEGKPWMKFFEMKLKKVGGASAAASKP